MRPRLHNASMQAAKRLGPRLDDLAPDPAGQSHRWHHYVPQFWLKKFTDDRGRLCVVDPSGEHSPRTAGARSEAAVDDLYATHAEPSSVDESGKPELSVQWEHICGFVESEASRPFTRLAKGRTGSALDLSDLERLWISVFVALQVIRVPRRFEAVRAFADRLAQATAMHMVSLGPPREWMTDDMCREAGIEPADIEGIEWTPAAFGPDGDFAASIDPLSDVPSMLSHAFDDEIVAYVFSRTWSIIKFPEGGLTLPLDDGGVYLKTGKTSGFWDSLGLGTADEIWVPMSPDTLLVMHWRDDRFDPSNWPAEGCVAQLGHRPNRHACHPDDAQQAASVWDACRNSRDKLSKLGRESTNIGVPHLVGASDSEPAA